MLGTFASQANHRSHGSANSAGTLIAVLPGLTSQTKNSHMEKPISRERTKLENVPSQVKSQGSSGLMVRKLGKPPRLPDTEGGSGPHAVEADMAGPKRLSGLMT